MGKTGNLWPCNTYGEDTDIHRPRSENVIEKKIFLIFFRTGEGKDKPAYTIAFSKQIG
jgi:hypothetical protein